MRTSSLFMAQSNDTVVPIVMPSNAAQTPKTLERGSRPYSVVEILRDVFQADFRKAIQDYMEQYPESAEAAIGVSGAKELRLLYLSEPKVESSLRQPACSTAVDLIFWAVVEALIPAVDQSDPDVILERRSFTANYRMRYLISLWDKRCSVPIIAPAASFPTDTITEQKTAITNQYLLPILYTEEYINASKRMLERYYPEALNTPTAVNGWELAKRMKLDARSVRFEQDSDIQGRIYFDKTWVTMRGENGEIVMEEIPPMTILINSELCKTKEIENSTLIHECCHVFLDLLFFKLQMLGGNPATSYTNRKKKKWQYTRPNGPIEWMELQAEKLTAYILMEENNTRNEIERLLSLRGGIRSPENLFWVMCRLATTFKVSRCMAKYRMIELGYQEAEGIYVYLDNVRIPDYGCSGTWQRGITYTISRSDAGALLLSSKEFCDVLQSGRYAYVEGHFCLDTEPYIETNYKNDKRLSAYARHHIDECCISFIVRGRYTNTGYNYAWAARKTEVKDKYQSRHAFGAEPETKARLKENMLFTQDSQVWMKLRLAMPDSIGKAIQLILDEKGITQMELAMRLGVSRAAWRKWCAEKMSIRHIVAICIALDVRADIGMELVRLAGHSFMNNKEHNLLMAMIFETKDLTIVRANEIMRQNKLPPLTEGRDEWLAC